MAATKEKLRDRVTRSPGIRKFNERKKLEDTRRRQRIVRNKFLHDQIIKHDRIDLLMTEVLGYEVKDFHMLMYTHRKHYYRSIDKQQWHLSLAPRGGGKTTILTISSIILDVLKNPDIRILIASKTDSNAVEMLSEIKKKLVSKRVTEIFGEQRGNVWNDGELNTSGRAEDAPKGKTVTTVGVGSALASRHFDKVYADDLVDESNSITELQREKIFNWFYKVLDPTIVPDGIVSIVGTRYHFSDLYGRLIETKLTKVSKKTGKVLKKYYIRIPALFRRKDWQKFKKRSKRYISFWPERFSVKFLLAKRKTQGTIIFNSQMQNDTEAMKGKIFQYDWFRWYDAEDVPLSELRIVQGVDLAIKQSEKADKFAHCTIGVHPKTKNIYVLNYYNQVTHYTKQKALIKAKHDMYDPIRVGIEANGYQLALLQDMRDNPDLASIRAVPVYTETDKTVRAWKLSAYFERGQVFLLRGMNVLQQHLLQMPDGRYKDLFDALDIAVELAFSSKRKVRDYEPGII